jgi:Na+/H+ antiporter NhaD/arsenite permease-like protein
MESLAIAVFVVVYAGMILGGLPRLALDRTGVALLGAIVLVAGGDLSLEEAAGAVDAPTLALLFGLMIVSAQFRLGGFYTHVTRRLAAHRASPEALLAALVATAGVLSALLANDIVCLAMAPILVEVCSRRRLDPVPFLLALACASNVGSAATLIGNPQNMLIGETLRLSFAGYLADALVPSVLGLAATWAILARQWRGRFERETPLSEVHAPAFDRWQSTKGILVLSGVVIAFLVTEIPRDHVALAAAGVLLLSRRMASSRVLGLVDWELLVLFFGLFVVNRAFEETGLLARALESLAASGLDLSRPDLLFTTTVVLSNLVSNVPAVMLLLPVARPPEGGAILALASTLAGNLLLVGSIANLIVVDQARRLVVGIGWATHARAGVPVTLATLAIAAGWLWLRSG